MDKRKLKCGYRSNISSSCEKLPMHGPNWWDRLFEIMEKEVKIPVHQRFSVLREIFPEKILNKIVHALNNVTITSCEPDECTCACGLLMGITDGEIDQGTQMKLLSHSDSNPPTIVKRKGSEVSLRLHRSHNPYTNFFRRSPELAAIWRSPGKPNLTHLSLMEKARVVTELIAVDFVQWMQRLNTTVDSNAVSDMFMAAFKPRKPIQPDKVNDPKQPVKQREGTMGVKEVMKMFDVGTTNETTSSLKVAVKELGSVTKSIAKYLHMPEMDPCDQYQKYIQKDSDITPKKVKSVAFGKCLPPELRYKPCILQHRSNLKAKELKQKEAVTLKSFYDSIAHLPSTLRYCKWLNDHPEVTPPNNLLMYHRNYLKRNKSQIKLIKSGVSL